MKPTYERFVAVPKAGHNGRGEMWEVIDLAAAYGSAARLGSYFDVSVAIALAETLNKSADTYDEFLNEATNSAREPF